MAVLKEFYKDALPDVPVRNSRYFIRSGGKVIIYNIDGDGVATVEGAVVSKADIGLGNVDNTSDASKPVSTAMATALSGKADTGHTHSGLAPSGGTTGQVLKKISNTSYNYSWQNETGGGGGSAGISASEALLYSMAF